MIFKLVYSSLGVWTLAAGLLVAAWVRNTAAVAQADQEITLRFQAMVGDQEFACGQSYTGLGTGAEEMMPTDFRLYVSEVALIEASGESVPVQLEQDGKWQFETVALLDFEDKSGPCRNGTTETRQLITGTVPAGDYQGVQFTLGVPFDLNHGDVTLAPSPLNLTSMWWNWQGGYKFVRIDLDTPMARVEMATAEAAEEHGSDHGTEAAAPGEHAAHGGATGYLIHLGSTGCQVPEAEQQPTECANPNRTQIQFDTFDLEQDVVVVDLAALVADSDLGSNQPETPLGCMSGPEDQDCTELFANLGLTAEDQNFFRVE